MRFEGRTILITGASSGIGLALAFVLAGCKARLILVARHAGSLEDAAEQIGQAHRQSPPPVIMTADVTDRAAVGDLFRRCREHHQNLDVLINNAGMGVYGDTQRTSLDDTRRVMEVNYFGALNCLFEALPWMRENSRGLIVNITSLAAKHGVPYLAAYSASKAALSAFGQGLRAELDGTGIEIMNVYPGYTETDFFRQEKKVGGARRPQGPFRSADRVARAVVRGMEKGRHEYFPTMAGRLLPLLQALLPGLTERLLARYAARLRE